MTADRLLQAAIDALSDLGYARTTTIEVVERSGLSRGALLHHYASRADLLAAAVTRIAEDTEEALRDNLSAIEPSDERFSGFVDAVWDAFSGPLFYASLELWVAARTDEELRSALLAAERSVGRSLRRVAGSVVDEDRPEDFAIFELTLALMRGLAVTRILRGDVRTDALLQTWKDMVAQHREAAGSHPANDGEEG